MSSFASVALRRLVAPLALLLLAAHAPAQTRLMVYDFTLGGTPAENVDEVAALGFRGLVTRIATPADLNKLQQYADHVATLDGFSLQPYVAYDFSKPGAANVWRDALPVLAEVGAHLWVVVKAAPTGQAIRDLLAEMADEASALGVLTVVYPHFATSIETADEAAAVIADVGHPDLRNSLHTCHEIRGGFQDDMAEVVAAHAADTALVAIAGAEQDAYSGPPGPLITWGDVIKPLDKGNWSLAPFLTALEESGYDGPVILQTFGIVGDPNHLQHSIRKYAEYVQQVTWAAGR